MTTNSAADRTTVLVCITCRASTDPIDSPKGMALANATTDALGDAVDVNVLRVRCLGNCNRGLSAAIRRENAWTYVFGGLDAQRDGPTLIAGARLFAESTDGLMPWRGRPDPLKRGLIARMPPLSFAGEPVDPSADAASAADAGADAAEAHSTRADAVGTRGARTDAAGTPSACADTP